jgi:hypothetical protein
VVRLKIFDSVFRQNPDNLPERSFSPVRSVREALVESVNLETPPNLPNVMP